MCYAKVALLAYPYLKDAVAAIDRQIEKRCRLSFYSQKPCFDYADKIAKLISDKRYLLLLEEKITAILQRLNDEERILIGYKYFKNRPIDGFDYKSRKYFRKQIRVLDKFTKMLELIRLDEKTFLKIYADIPYIKSIMIRVEEVSAA